MYAVYVTYDPNVEFETDTLLKELIHTSKLYGSVGQGDPQAAPSTAEKNICTHTRCILFICKKYISYRI